MTGTRRRPRHPAIRRRFPATALCTLAAGLALASCASDPSQGYSFASTYSESIRTVSVPIFENSTFNVGVETELTEAIIAEIRRSTPWGVIAERPGGGGDATLSGVIKEVELVRLSTSRSSGLVEEEIVRVTVDFDWRDNRTGSLLLSRRTFSAGGSFLPSRPTAERIDVGRREAVQQLARDIVRELRDSW